MRSKGNVNPSGSHIVETYISNQIDNSIHAHAGVGFGYIVYIYPKPHPGRYSWHSYKASLLDYCEAAMISATTASVSKMGRKTMRMTKIMNTRTTLRTTTVSTKGKTLSGPDCPYAASIPKIVYIILLCV